jgi:hypothetical protein
LFCRAHNQLIAERDFTREHIQHCIRARQAERSKSSSHTPAAAAFPGLELSVAPVRAADEGR